MKHQFTINVWAEITADFIIGPYELLCKPFGRLVYIFNRRISLSYCWIYQWQFNTVLFMHVGAPAHFTCNIKQFLDSSSHVPVRASEGHNLLVRVNMQDQRSHLIQVAVTTIRHDWNLSVYQYQEFFVPQGCYAFKIVNSILNNFCKHFINIKLLLKYV